MLLVFYSFGHNHFVWIFLINTGELSCYCYFKAWDTIICVDIHNQYQGVIMLPVFYNLGHNHFVWIFSGEL